MSTIEPRDGELDRLYREAGGDEPPPRLDAAILARARSAAAQEAPTAPDASADKARTRATAVLAKPASGGDGRAGRAAVEPPTELWPFRHPRSWLMRWRVPLAVAATLLVSATVTVMLQDAGVPGLPRSMQAPDGNNGPSAARGVVREMPSRPSPVEPAVEAQPAAPDPRPAATARSNAASAAGEPKAQEATAAAEKRGERRAGAPGPASAPPAGGAVKDEPLPSPAADTSETQRSMPADASAAAKAEGEAASSAPAPQPEPRLRDAREDRSTRVESEDAAPAQSAPSNALESPRQPRSAKAPPSPAASAARPDGEPLAPSGTPDAPRGRAMERAPIAASSPAASSATEATSPEAIVERVRALRREGREEEALKLLRELAERHPDFELPEDLRPAR